MKTVAVIIDNWKLAVFARRLRAAQFAFTIKPLTENTLLLTVTAYHIIGLPGVIEAAQRECADAMS